MAKGYWMIHVNVTNARNCAEYVRLDTPVIESFGGRFIARGGRSLTPESPQKDRHVIVEFPDYEAALACYRSEEYQRATAIRRANAETDFVIVEGMT